MNYQEFVSAFKKQVFLLPYERQLHFAIEISKRLFFDYQNFFEFHQFGNPDLLMDAIGVCAQSTDGVIDINKVDEMITKIYSITPHMDDCGDNIGSFALNACSAVYETLQFLKDKDQSHIYNVGICYTDTIDFKIQENDDLTDNEINNNTIMNQAWNFILEQIK